MSRGDHRIDSTPYGSWIATVDAQNRIRLPLEIQSVITWLHTENGTIDCAGAPGPAGGLQIEPITMHEKLRSDFTDAIAKTLPKSSESGETWVEIARLLATSWRIAISIESSRISITLPEPARRLLRLPGRAGTAVVFGFGEILEVWDAVNWHDHVRSVAKTKSFAFSQAISDIRDR
jgi:DNA-binding transcriptional regulator/RsmH inhibitor MraZ